MQSNACAASSINEDATDLKEIPLASNTFLPEDVMSIQSNVVISFVRLVIDM
jgi:hypothetical protein